MSRGSVKRADDRRLGRTAPIERMLARLGPRGEESCWIWPGATNGVGYGVIGSGGNAGGRLYVHRVSYEHFVGPIPEGLVIDHLCRNRRCCNPRHLEPVTHRVNLLRGVGVSAQAAAKTECVNGHPFDDTNTYRYADGSRSCRACARAHQRNRRARRKEAA